MSIADLFHNVLGHHDTSEEVVGTIVDKPVLRDNDKATGEIVSFHLDSRPEVEFRQELSPLTPTHHPGDRVRVHCHVANDVAQVDWVEQA